MMKRVFLIVAVLFLVSISPAYAQDNFLYITADISENNLTIESNYDYRTDFNINDFIEKIDGQYIFTFSYSAEVDLKNFKLKIILPENAVVSEKRGALILSRPVQISTDGRRIFLEWSQTLNADEDFTAFAQYQTKEATSNKILLIFVTIVMIAFLIGYKSKVFKKERFIDKSISQDEKTIINIMKKEKEIMQDSLREKTGWSKTKISKIIRNLEAKELIEKKPYKKTNKLKLK